MRFHLVSLPHTQTTSEFISCAYTQKVVKFARMMKPRGHEIILYSGEENEAPCDEHVQVVSHREQKQWFGKKDLNAMYPITWDLLDRHWMVTNERVIKHITKGLKSGKYDKTDMVCIIAGTCNRQIDKYLLNICPEYGVGYTGTFTHAAFESHYHRATVYKMQGVENGKAYDTVIPNYFDPAEFEMTNVPKREDHLLYVGRLISRKGIGVAAQAAQASGRKLLIAGQGAIGHGYDPDGKGWVESDELKVEGNIEFIGTLDVKQRAYEMSRAHAVLAPTSYIEPFGGVAVEAGFCGTPVITTNWGAYAETVLPGVTGYRPDILREYVQAIEDAGPLGKKRDRIIDSVTARYSLDVVAPQFEHWFEKLETLWDKGWYAD